MRVAFLASAILIVAPACTRREVPTEFPPCSAASLRAPVPPPAVVTAAMTGDPPLPGDDVSRWSGLAGAPSGATSPDNSMHMHGGGMHVQAGGADGGTDMETTHPEGHHHAP